MGKRLLLITGNFSPELNGIGKYNGEMIRWLAGKGYDCTVVTTYPYYPQWKVQAPYTSRRYRYTRETWMPDGAVIYRCPQYIPSVPTGSKRVMQDASFFFSSGCKLAQLLFSRKFDVVMTVAPSFQLGLLAAFYKRISGARFVYHIQDLQIEAARNLNMIRRQWLIRRLFQVERFILRRADVVSSISEGMIRKIKEKAGKDIFSFPNWVDLQCFYPVAGRAALKESAGYGENDRIILYSGAIGEKQGLESILEAAAALRHDSRLKFLICGSGPYGSKLSEQAGRLGLSNVIFLPLQPAAHFNDFLNMADVHLVIQKSEAGDLVMPSKLSTIMAVGGVCIITANAGTTLYDIVERHKTGLLVNADDPAALTAAIRRAVNEDLSVLGRNARAYAESHLSVEKIMAGFEAVLRS
jgi:colanic acid biosynthesis glycosyl transferase WcaI